MSGSLYSTLLSGVATTSFCLEMVPTPSLPLRYIQDSYLTIGCWLRAGGLGSIGLGGLGTLSGLNRQTPAVKTAAERAAEAAARIPDPPAGTPRQKCKSVSFVEDGELACVRYFLKVWRSVSL